MITLRRAKERQHQRRRKQEAWLTFDAQEAADTLAGGFGALGIFKEGRLPPRTGTKAPREDAEIITYVLEGTLSYEDSMGQSGFIQAGEFQRMTAGRAVRYSETNASPTEWAHVFQIWLRPSVAGLEPGHEQKYFSFADRHGILRVVASPDARDDSLRIHQDAFLYSAILDRGGHVAHRLSEGRGAWLHIVRGEVTLGEVVLGTGDGVGVTAERVVSMTAREETEILLVDLAFEATEQLAMEGATEIATLLVSETSSPVPKKRNRHDKEISTVLARRRFRSGPVTCSLAGVGRELQLLEEREDRDGLLDHAHSRGGHHRPRLQARSLHQKGKERSDVAHRGSEPHPDAFRRPTSKGRDLDWPVSTVFSRENRVSTDPGQLNNVTEGVPTTLEKRNRIMKNASIRIAAIFLVSCAIVLSAGCVKVKRKTTASNDTPTTSVFS